MCFGLARAEIADDAHEADVGDLILAAGIGQPVTLIMMGESTWHSSSRNLRMLVRALVSTMARLQNCVYHAG